MIISRFFIGSSGRGMAVFAAGEHLGIADVLSTEAVKDCFIQIPCNSSAPVIRIHAVIADNADFTVDRPAAAEAHHLAVRKLNTAAVNHRGGIGGQQNRPGDPVVRTGENHLCRRHLLPGLHTQMEQIQRGSGLFTPEPRAYFH